MDGAAGGPGAVQGMERPRSTCLTLQKSPGRGAAASVDPPGAKVPLWGCQGIETPLVLYIQYIQFTLFTFSHPSPAWGGWRDG